MINHFKEKMTYERRLNVVREGHEMIYLGTSLLDLVTYFVNFQKVNTDQLILILQQNDVSMRLYDLTF